MPAATARKEPRFLTAVVEPGGGLAPGASFAVVPWWSFTKTLIAACALLLARQGLLDLDAPMAGRPFTARQLLRHTAGVGDYGGLPAYKAAVARGDAPWSDAALLALVSPDRLLFPPGIDFAYSNVGYLLLRRLLEGAAGAGLGEVLAGLALRPLGLAAARLAEGPEDMDGTAFAGDHGYHPGWCYPGTVVGPVAEAALALHRLATGNLLSPDLRRAMREATPVDPAQAAPPWRSPGYGLGFMLGAMAATDTARPLAVFGHSAGGPGSVGAVYHAPEPGRGRTAAVFADVADTGLVEARALALLEEREEAGTGGPRPGRGAGAA